MEILCVPTSIEHSPAMSDTHAPEDSLVRLFIRCHTSYAVADQIGL